MQMNQTPGSDVTFVPSSTSMDSATIEIREGDGTTNFKKKQIVGARGTFTIEGQKGDVMLANFVFTGRYVKPSDTTALTTQAIATTPQPFLNAGLSFHGQGSLKLDNLTIDIGNDVALRNDVNQACRQCAENRRYPDQYQFGITVEKRHHGARDQQHKRR